MKRALLIALTVAACGRLETVGQAPELTPPGQPISAVAPIAAQRVAIATPAPVPRPEAYATGSLWRSGPESLFGDRRARGLGDILTVTIEIDDEAAISNATRRARSGSESLSVPAFFGIPELANRVLPEGSSLDNAAAVDSSSASNGDGSVQRTEEIALRVAATVVGVLPNGHLVISGNQEVRVNFELRDLQVAGVIRPEDISRANEITFDKIAEARVSYGGRGQITDVQQPRYGQQVADIILPF
ncbi:MAG: flagellar basal body L-ring protein FlgH [Pseudomonadota bacterium]